MSRENKKTILKGEEMKKSILLSIVLIVIAGCGVSEQQRALQQEREKELKILEEEQDLLVEKLKKQRQAIREIAQEYGSKNLDKRQEIKLERIGMLLSELTKYEALALKNEAQINILKKTVEDQDADEQKLTEAKLKLANAEAELELNKELESRLHQILEKEEAETIEIGRKQLEIDDLQKELALTKEAYKKISQRIKELESD
jgi:hypothetical protein